MCTLCHLWYILTINRKTSPMDLLEKELGKKSAVSTAFFIFSSLISNPLTGLSVRELANRMLFLIQVDTDIRC